MAVIQCKDVSVAFGDRTLFAGVGFSLEAGDKLGLVGVNGAGKTTLLKVLLGEMEATDGVITIANGAKIGYLGQQVRAHHSNFTLFEEMRSGFTELIRIEEELERVEKELHAENADTSLLDRYQRLSEQHRKLGGDSYRSRIAGVLKKLGFSEEMQQRPVNTLSGGQQTTLALAGLLLNTPDILFLDEPTNHLDIRAVTWLEEQLRNMKVTLITVSHDRYFLDSVTNKTLEIENGRGTFYKGNYSYYTEEKVKNAEIYEKHYRDQQKEIRRIEAYIALQRKWNRQRNIIAAESRQKALDRMVKLDKPMPPPMEARFQFEGTLPSGNDVLNVSNLSMRFGEKTLFEGLSFEVKKDDRFFIVGPNGCGKSTVLKILCGVYPPYRGTYNFGYNVKIGYYDQENQRLNPDNTVLEELREAGGETSNEKLRGLLALFLFRGEDAEKKIAVLSGGERARITLAKLMTRRCNVLILDEPTNHLDAATCEALEGALTAFDGTVIAVSHDRYLLTRMATRILAFSAENTMVFEGGYEEYRSWLSENDIEMKKEPKAPSEAAEAYRDLKKRRSEEKKAQRRLAFLESEIPRLEDEIKAIDEKMMGEAATDYKKLEELSAQKEEMENTLMSLYEEWEASQS